MRGSKPPEQTPLCPLARSNACRSEWISGRRALRQRSPDQPRRWQWHLYGHQGPCTYLCSCALPTFSLFTLQPQRYGSAPHRLTRAPKANTPYFPAALTQLPMKILIALAIFAPLALLLSSCQSGPNGLPPVSSIPPSVAKEGTLANAKLVEDTSNALFDNLVISSTDRLQTRILKFVIQQPVGPAGRKAWREMWILMKDGSAGRRFIVTFSEDGAGSADFKIEG